MLRLCTKAEAKSKAKAKALGIEQKHKNNNKSQSHVVGKYLWMKPAKFPNFELANASEKKYPRGEEGKEAVEQLSRVAQKYRAAAWDICFAV